MTNKRSIAQLQAKTLPILLELVIHVGIGTAAPLHASSASAQASISSQNTRPLSQSSSSSSAATTSSSSSKPHHSLRHWHSHKKRSIPQPIAFSGRMDEVNRLDALQREAMLQGLQNYILHNTRHVIRDKPPVEAERLERVRRVVQKNSEEGLAKVHESVSPQLAVLHRKLGEQTTATNDRPHPTQ
ncbi:hypothetical protein AAVH_03448 [Aphelenchoides avenae]|nr:hypothetical protein AAVH_03448 [Aphelenchus avenae]